MRIKPRGYSLRRSQKKARALACAVETLEPRTLFNTTFIYVDAGAAGANNGSTWANAFTSLQAGLGKAQADLTASPNNPVIIDVSQGIYKPTATNNPDIAFHLLNGVSIVGGFAGDGEPDPGVRSIFEYKTILSGDIGAPGVFADNSYHVLVGSGTNSTAFLSGVTVELGNANGTAIDHYNSGGGLFNNGGSPSLYDCTFTGNYGLYGGAIDNEHNSDPTLKYCDFNDNTALGDGGAIRDAYSSSPVISGDSFDNNRAEEGGAIFNYNSGPAIFNSYFGGDSAGYAGGAIENLFCPSGSTLDCTFDGDHAQVVGGAIYNDHSYQTTTGCSFHDNTVSTGGGGAIANRDCYGIYVTYCSFTYNTALDGGAIENLDCAGGITNCHFDYNRAYSNDAYSAGRGGAIDNQYCYGLLINECEFNGDEAGNGGAIYNAETSGFISNCNFPGDSSAYTGGAIGNYQCNDYLTISNCTFPTDFSGIGGAIANTDSIPTITECTFNNDLANSSGGAISNVDSSASILSCSFNNDTASYRGGSIYNESCQDVTIDNCTFDGDSATTGGAIANNGSFAAIDSCTFTGDSAVFSGGSGGHDGAGGAISDNFYSSPSISNSTFTDNRAQDGGAIFNYYYSDPAIDQCKFTGNYAQSNGGAIDNDECYSYLTISQCTFEGDDSGATGGAIFSELTSATISNCDFVRDTAFLNGGAVGNSNDADAIIQNCTFDGDGAESGGAISLYFGYSQIAGCAFVGNHASSYGGAIYNYADTAKVVNCTIAYNSAGFDGGGISTRYFYDRYTFIHNSILWGDGPDEIQGSNVVGFTDIKGGIAGPANIDIAPAFLRYPDVNESDYGDLQMASFSATINAGNNFYAHQAGLLTDIAGDTRIIGGRVDMGAYEFGPHQAPNFTSPDSDTFTVGVYSEFFITTNGDPVAQIEEQGALPNGLSIFNYNNGSAVIYGTAQPGDSGSYSETFTASNGDLPDATQNFTLNIEPSLEFTSPSQVTFAIGSDEAFNVTTKALPASTTTLTIEGALPPDVLFTDNGDGTGTFSAVPEFGDQGIYQFSIIANDGSQQVVQQFQITITLAPQFVTSSTVTFNAGDNTSFTIATLAFPNPSISEFGNLPAGLTFQDNGDGTATLFGTPAPGTEGTYILRLNADNGTEPAAQQYLVLTVVNSAVYWTGDGDARNWGDPQNWSIDQVPTSLDNATIGAGFGVIQVATSAYEIDSFTASSNINITSQLDIYSPSQLTGALTIKPGGTLNIDSASLLINYAAGNSPAPTLVPYLALGYAGGAWNGTGIISSTAANNVGDSIGYADGSVDTGTPALADQFLIKYTRAGDANLNGTTDFTDLFALGKHLNTTGNDWANGNFGYVANGAVDFSDLFIQGQNLNKQASPAAATAVSIGQTILSLSDAASSAAAQQPAPDVVRNLYLQTSTPPVDSTQNLLPADNTPESLLGS